MTPDVTALYAGLSSLLLIYLAFNVTGFRRRKVIEGHADFNAMQVAIRAHGNASEYIPIALILLFLAEQNGVATIWLHVLGAAFLASRVGHAWGYITSRGGASRGRFFGTATCFFVIAALAMINITCFITR